MFGLSKYIIGVLLLILVIGSGISYWYYKDSQATIQTLQENNVKLQTANDFNQAAITQLKADAEKFSIANSKLRADLQRSEKYRDALNKKLNDHSLQNLSIKKPNIIEKRINDATQKIFRELEADSGSPQPNSIP